MPHVLDSDTTVQGGLTCTTLTINSTATQLSATKLQHQYNRTIIFDGATDVSSGSAIIHATFGATATIVAGRFWTETAPAGGNLQFTIDFQKGNAGSVFSSILSSVLTIDSSRADRTPYGATFSGTALVAGDIVQIVVAASGTTGTQAQGGMVQLIVREDPA